MTAAQFKDARGNYHAVTHNQGQGNVCGNASLGSTCGAHLFSKDSFTWTISPTPGAQDRLTNVLEGAVLLMSVTDVFAVYTHDVVMEGGGSRQLQTRQRPQIIFGEGGAPTHLVSVAAPFASSSEPSKKLRATVQRRVLRG